MKQPGAIAYLQEKCRNNTGICVFCYAVAVFFLSLCIQFIYYLGFDGHFVAVYPLSDSAVYLHKAWYAAFIDETGGFLSNVIPLSIYVDILELSFTLLGPSLHGAYIANSILLASSIVLLNLLALNLSNHKISVIVAVLLLLCGHLVFYAGLTLKTNAVMLFLSLTLFTLERYHVKKSPIYLFICILSLGLAAIDRNQLILLYFPIIIYILFNKNSQFKKYRHGLVFVSGILAVAYISGWDWREQEQKFFSPVGWNYYLGNAPGSWGGYTHIDGMPANIVGDHTYVRTYAAEKIGGTPSRSDVSLFWLSRSYEYFSREPAEYGMLHLRKAGLILARYSQGLPEEFRVWKSGSHVLSLLPVDYAVILWLSIIGIYAALRFKLSSLDRLYLSFVVIYSLTLLIFLVGDRYKITLLVLLIPFAVKGIVYFMNTQGRKRIIVASVLVVGFISSHYLSYLNKPGPGFSSNPRASFNALARPVEIRSNIYDAKISVVRDNSPHAWGSLARYFYHIGFHSDAAVFAENAIKADNRNIDGYIVLYEIYRTSSDDVNLGELKRAIQRELSGLTSTNNQDRRLLFLLGRIDAAINHLQ